jgi:hypothetical protein
VWLAGYFKGYFVGESVREVCAVSEDILLSEGDGRSESKDNGRALARREASASRVAKWHTRKSRFQQKYQEIGSFNSGG